PSIWAAVNAGATLVIYDRYVDQAETILPGGAGFNIVRNFDDPSNINVLDSASVLANGPGGVITNTALDGARFSSHGYALASSLPAGADLFFSNGTASHIVAFSYRYGMGNVLYASIPLDSYLGGTTAFATIFAPNLVAEAVTLLNAAPVAL